MRSRRAPALLAAALAVGLLAWSACTDDQGSPTPSGSASNGTTEQPTDEPTDGATDGPNGGPSDAPTRVEPGTDLLDWHEVPGSVDDTVTVSGDWTLTVPATGDRAVLENTSSDRAPITLPAGPRGRISDAFLAGGFALVVSQDQREVRPARAVAVELASGRRTALDADSSVPTTTGGSWALGPAAEPPGARVLYPTVRDGAYCLAGADLAPGAEAPDAAVLWCAEPRHGFSSTRATAAGDALMTFDDSRPSCRTVAAVADGTLEPFAGVPDCKGWEGVLLPDGRVWSVIPREKRIEAARVYATLGDGYVDLGPALTRSLLACGDAAYFARDPAGPDQPGQVLRWRSDGSLDVVYEAPGGGEGFVAVPLRCGDDALTVTALTEEGDEQVTAHP